jgi:hypothetical protein
MDAAFTIATPEIELVLWDGGTRTAYMLGRGNYQMPARTKAIAKALLLHAFEEIEAVES